MRKALKFLKAVGISTLAVIVLFPMFVGYLYRN